MTVSLDGKDLFTDMRLHYDCELRWKRFIYRLSYFNAVLMEQLIQSNHLSIN